MPQRVLMPGLVGRVIVILVILLAQAEARVLLVDGEEEELGSSTCGVFSDKWEVPGMPAAMLAMAGVGRELMAANDCIHKNEVATACKHWRLSGKGCVGSWGISGTKAFCCKIVAACGPGQYGKPGCPYPPFGNASDSDEGKSSGPSPPPDVIRGRQQESSGTPVLVPTPSTGPTPFGSGAPSNPEEAEAWRREQEKAKSTDAGIKLRPKNDVLQKSDPTGGCGKGMYKGGDGRCHPRLN